MQNPSSPSPTPISNTSEESQLDKFLNTLSSYMMKYPLEMNDDKIKTVIYALRIAEEPSIDRQNLQKKDSDVLTEFKKLTTAELKKIQNSALELGFTKVTKVTKDTDGDDFKNDFKNVFKNLYKIADNIIDEKKEFKKTLTIPQKLYRRVQRLAGFAQPPTFQPESVSVYDNKIQTLYGNIKKILTGQFINSPETKELMDQTLVEIKEEEIASQIPRPPRGGLPDSNQGPSQGGGVPRFQARTPGSKPKTLRPQEKTLYEKLLKKIGDLELKQNPQDAQDKIVLDKLNELKNALDKQREMEKKHREARLKRWRGSRGGRQQ